MTKNLTETAWARPQQLAVTVYGVWITVLTVLLAVLLENPHRNVDVMRSHGLTATDVQARMDGYRSGLVLVAIEALLYLLIAFFAFFAYRGRTWPFWPAVILFGITGLGAVWVPLRPEAHAGFDETTLIVHAFLADLPGLLTALWLLAGLIRYHHTWSRRQQPAE
jgi:hypothetical protein